MWEIDARVLGQTHEFGEQNRPPGWNFWLTFAISPAPPSPAAPSMAYK
jgi:hypothetical protein